MKRINWVLLSSFLAVSASAQPLTLSDLRSSLSKHKATWTAGQTKVSVLDKEEQKRLLGAPLPEHQDYFFTPESKTFRPFGPAAYDWRNVGGTKFSSPVLDQGRCGSCVAFAAIGQLETQMNIARKTPHSPWAFSPQHLFACGGGTCDRGWMPMTALNYLQSSGVPDEACFPYQSGATGEDLACSSSCSDAKSRSQKIVRYNTTSFFFASIDSVKKALQKGPLLASMVVYEDFMFYKSGVYKYTSGAQLGGHAVVIEGYNDSEKAWIVRNSWGEDWGDNGYFRVAWNDQSGVGNSTWGIEIGGADGDVSLGSLRDHTVLSGNAQVVQLASSYTDTQRIRWQLLNGSSTSVAEGSASRSSSVVMDTTPLRDGAYQMVAIADRASGVARSQPREVYVLNGTLTGSIKLNNVSSGDTLKGKKVLEFSLNSAPIPFTHLAFRAKNVATGEVIERRSPHVASKINLSFNTEGKANGAWELSLEGIAGTQSVRSQPVRVTFQN